LLYRYLLLQQLHRSLLVSQNYMFKPSRTIIRFFVMHKSWHYLCKYIALSVFKIVLKNLLKFIHIVIFLIFENMLYSFPVKLFINCCFILFIFYVQYTRGRIHDSPNIARGTVNISYVSSASVDRPAISAGYRLHRAGVSFIQKTTERRT
jgi:hypothetical protein